MTAALATINEDALIESRQAREQFIDRDYVLDRAKALTMLPDGIHATTEQVASYYGALPNTIRALTVDHRDELESDGMKLVTGTELSDLKSLCGIRSKARSMMLYPRRAMFRIGLLLRDSVVPKALRSYLLNVEQIAPVT